MFLIKDANSQQVRPKKTTTKWLKPIELSEICQQTVTYDMVDRALRMEVNEGSEEEKYYLCQQEGAEIACG